MWRNSLRDLRWRWRRFVVALVGAALVFASTLVMVGLSNTFDDEVTESLAAVGADGWIGRPGTGGPLTSVRFLSEGRADEIGRLPGVERADPFIFLRQTVRGPDGIVDALAVGHRLGGIGSPPVARGRAPAASGEAAADESLGLSVGRSIDVAGRKFRIVGTTKGLTLFAGSPLVFLPIADVQNVLLFGQRLANVVVVRGRPTTLPSGLTLMTTAEVADDAKRPLKKAVGALVFAQRVLWVVAAFVIGAVVYTSALERARDFAVFKATGVSSGYVLGGLALQSVLVAVGAAGLGIGIARILVSMFPLRVDLAAGALPALFAVAIVIGLIASLFGARRAVRADPALAFGGP